MANMNSVGMAGSAASRADVVPQLQVASQLDTACFSLDALEATVTTLLNRLTEVTGGYPEECKEPTGMSSLVPVAARISYIDGRVRRVEASLSRALDAMQI